MDGLITQAVHATDCFDFDNASKLMAFVAESLKTQSNRFHEYLPTEFPEQLKFDLRARALGTLVQSESLAGARDPSRLLKAREASEEAVAEFTSFGDRARQYQYRCHLETIAGNFETARQFLVQSLERSNQTPADFSHKRITELVQELASGPDWRVEFTLVHWLRLGAAACLRQHRTQPAVSLEGESFLRALEDSGLLESAACQGRLMDYPTHSILRYVAVIQAARGKVNESIAALTQLYELEPVGKGQFTLAMILLAAQTEVETLLEKSLFGASPKIRSLSSLVEQVAERVASDLGAFSNALQDWKNAISSSGSLLPLARTIAY